MSLMFEQLGFFTVAGALLGIGILTLFTSGNSLFSYFRSQHPDYAVNSALAFLLAGLLIAGSAFTISYGLSLR